MLTIMQPTLWWFNFVGVLGHKRSEHPHGETLLTIVRRTVTILVMLVNPYPQTVYLFANLDNIIEAAFSIYFVVVGVGMLVQLCVLMRNRVAVRQLVDHIEAIVNEKIQQNGYVHFERAHRMLERVLSAGGNIVLVSFVIYVSSPLAIILTAYLRNSLRPEHFVAPLRDLYYFFDATTSPLFEVCYAANAAKVALVCMVYVTVDFFFVEISVYVLAMYAELKQMVGELHAMKQADRRSAELRRCIRFHIEIVGIINHAQSILNNVVAAQLIYSVITLATNLFTALYIELMEYPKMISSCGCFALELFAFCWLGSKVLDENDRLQEAIYDLPWYDYTPSERRLLRFMIQFTATQQVGFSAHKYLYCNIETFGMLISKVYSALAFLQNFV